MEVAQNVNTIVIEETANQFMDSVENINQQKEKMACVENVEEIKRKETQERNDIYFMIVLYLV